MNKNQSNMLKEIGKEEFISEQNKKLNVPKLDFSKIEKGSDPLSSRSSQSSEENRYDTKKYNETTVLQSTEDFKKMEKDANIKEYQKSKQLEILERRLKQKPKHFNGPINKKELNDIDNSIKKELEKGELNKTNKYQNTKKERPKSAPFLTTNNKKQPELNRKNEKPVINQKWLNKARQKS